MASKRIVALAALKFLSAVFSLFAVTLATEQALRGHNLIASLQSVSVRLLVAEPLLLTVGFAAALWLLRSRLPEGASQSFWRCGLAALVGVVVLGVTSVFAQGSHLLFIVVATVGVGLVAGLALVLATTAGRPSRASLPA